uniref:Bacteriohemerythrin n=1 Tax=candidate division WOR-3 bacterium TaxID=2052148 RepID=A0A7V4E4E7_UNCW3
MKIEFTDELLTYVPEMDNQHKKLVELVNKVSDLLKLGDTKTAMDILSKELKAYVDTHFDAEEKFMESIGFPKLESHRKIHEAFKKQVYEYVNSLKEGDIEAFREALSLTWSWLFNHIATVDKDYGIFAKEKGLI